MENHIHQAATGLADDNIGKVVTAGVATIITLVFSWKYISRKCWSRNASKGAPQPTADTCLNDKERKPNDNSSVFDEFENDTDLLNDNLLNMNSPSKDSFHWDDKFSDITSGYSSSSKLSPLDELCAEKEFASRSEICEASYDKDMNGQFLKIDNLYIDEIDGREVIINEIEGASLLPGDYEPTFSDSEYEEDEHRHRDLDVIVEESVSDDEDRDSHPESTLELKETILRQEKLKTFRQNFVQFGEYYALDDPFGYIPDEDDDVFYEEDAFLFIDRQRDSSIYNNYHKLHKNDSVNIINGVKTSAPDDRRTFNDANQQWNENKMNHYGKFNETNQGKKHSSFHDNENLITVADTSVTTNDDFRSTKPVNNDDQILKDTTDNVLCNNRGQVFESELDSITCHRNLCVTHHEPSHSIGEKLDSENKTDLCTVAGCHCLKEQCVDFVNKSTVSWAKNNAVTQTRALAEADDLILTKADDLLITKVGGLITERSSGGDIRVNCAHVESRVITNEVNVGNNINGQVLVLDTGDNLYDNVADDLVPHKTSAEQIRGTDNTVEWDESSAQQEQYCDENGDGLKHSNVSVDVEDPRDTLPASLAVPGNDVVELENGDSFLNESADDQTSLSSNIDVHTRDNLLRNSQSYSDSLSSDDSFDMDFQPPVFRRANGFPRTVSGEMGDLQTTFGGFQRFGSIPRTVSGPMNEIEQSWHSQGDDLGDSSNHKMPDQCYTGRDFPTSTTFALVGRENKNDGDGNTIEPKPRGVKMLNRTKRSEVPDWPSSDTASETSTKSGKQKKKSPISKLLGLFGKKGSAKNKLPSKTTKSPSLPNNKQHDDDSLQSGHRQLQRLVKTNDLREERERIILMASGVAFQKRSPSNDAIQLQNTLHVNNTRGRIHKNPPTKDVIQSHNPLRGSDIRSRQQTLNQTSEALNKYHDTKLDSINGSRDTKKSPDPRSVVHSTGERTLPGDTITPSRKTDRPLHQDRVVLNRLGHDEPIKKKLDFAPAEISPLDESKVQIKPDNCNRDIYYSNKSINLSVGGATSQTFASDDALDDGTRSPQNEFLRTKPQYSTPIRPRSTHGELNATFERPRTRSKSLSEVSAKDLTPVSVRRPGHFQRFASGGFLSSKQNQNPEWFAATLGDISSLTRRQYNSVLLDKSVGSASQPGRFSRSAEFEPNRSLSEDRRWEKRCTFLSPESSKNSKSLVELLKEKEETFKSRTFKSPLRGSYRLGFPVSWLKSTEEILERSSRHRHRSQPLTKLAIYSARPKLPASRESSPNKQNFLAVNERTDDTKSARYLGSCRSIVQTDIDSGKEVRLLVRETDVDSIFDTSNHGLPHEDDFCGNLPSRAHSMYEIGCTDRSVETKPQEVVHCDGKSQCVTNLRLRSSNCCEGHDSCALSDKTVNISDKTKVDITGDGYVNDRNGMLSGRNTSDTKTKDTRTDKDSRNGSTRSRSILGRLRFSKHSSSGNVNSDTSSHISSENGIEKLPSNDKGKSDKKANKKKKGKSKNKKVSNIGNRIAGLGRRRQNTKENRESVTSTSSSESSQSEEDLSNSQRKLRERANYKCPGYNNRMIQNVVTMDTDTFKIRADQNDNRLDIPNLEEIVRPDTPDLRKITTTVESELEIFTGAGKCFPMENSNDRILSYCVTKQPMLYNNVKNTSYSSSSDGSHGYNSLDDSSVGNGEITRHIDVKTVCTQYPEVCDKTKSNDDIFDNSHVGTSVEGATENIDKVEGQRNPNPETDVNIDYMCDKSADDSNSHEVSFVSRTNMTLNMDNPEPAEGHVTLKSHIETLNRERSTWYESIPTMTSSPHGSPRGLNSENTETAEYDEVPKSSRSFPVLAHSRSVNSSKQSTPTLKRRNLPNADIQIAFADTSLESSSSNAVTVEEDPPGGVTMDAVYDALLAIPSGSNERNKLEKALTGNGSCTPQRSTVNYFETDLDSDSTCSPSSDKSPNHLASSDWSLLNSSSDTSPEFNSSVESLDSVYVKCRNPSCGLREILASAQTHFKTCHNCVTYYCSRECRQAHWEKHKKRCMVGRVNSQCKHVIKFISEKDDALSEFSKTARLGYLTQGRGYVDCVFPTLKTANGFFKDFGNFNHSQYDVNFVSLKALNGFDSLEKYQQEITELVKTYNPEYKFVLSVTIATPGGWPQRPVPRKVAPLIHKYAKVKLSDTKSSSRSDIEKADTLILTAVPGTPDGKIFEGPKAREVFFINVQRNLRDKGVSLRHQYPAEYSKLCAYVERDEMFAPISLSPRDGRTGKRFMCLIMPKSDPENEWLNDPNLLKELGLL